MKKLKFSSLTIGVAFVTLLGIFSFYPQQEKVEFELIGPFNGKKIIPNYSKINSETYDYIKEDTLYQKASNGDGFCLLVIKNKSEKSVLLNNMLFENVMRPAEQNWDSGPFLRCNISRKIKRNVLANSIDTIACMIPKSFSHILMKVSYEFEGDDECKKQELHYIMRNSVMVEKTGYYSMLQDDYETTKNQIGLSKDSTLIHLNIGINQDRGIYRENLKFYISKIDAKPEKNNPTIEEIIIPVKGGVTFKIPSQSPGVYKISSTRKPEIISFYISEEEDFIYITKDPLIKSYNKFKFKVFGLKNEENKVFIEYCQNYNSTFIENNRISKKKKSSDIHSINNPLLTEIAYFYTFRRMNKSVLEKENIEVLKKLHSRLKNTYPDTYQFTRTNKFILENKLFEM